MFKQIITLIILINFIPATILAQTTTSTTGKFTEVQKGEKAPFTGYLLDPIATAEVLTFKKYTKREQEQRLNFELGKLKLEKDKQIETLRAELEIEKEKHLSLIEIKNEQIQQTIQTVVGSPGIDLTWLWVSLSFLAGVGITVLGIWGASKLKGEGFIITQP